MDESFADRPGSDVLLNQVYIDDEEGERWCVGALISDAFEITALMVNEGDGGVLHVPAASLSRMFRLEVAPAA